MICSSERVAVDDIPRALTAPNGLAVYGQRCGRNDHLGAEMVRNVPIGLKSNPTRLGHLIIGGGVVSSKMQQI